MASVIECGEFQNDGEKRLVEELVKLPDDYCIITNYKLKGRGAPLDIDVIVLAPHAIYVIEDKSWSGEITGDHTGWIYNGKHHKDVMDEIEHKAKVLKSALKDYYIGFDKISVQSSVSLSAENTPNIERLNIARKEYVFGLNKIVDFVSDPDKLERVGDRYLAGRYQSMIRRAIVKGLALPQNLRINSLTVERIAYPHNRYTPYLVKKDNDTVILKCYDLPGERRIDELEQFVREHHKVVERYNDVLQRLAEEPRDDGAHYIEIGQQSFVEKDKGLYVVPTRWQSGSWELLSIKRNTMDLNTKLEVAIRLCQGLEYAHAHKIVHRNLSLDSILVLDSGEIRIIDWDFAIFWDEKSRKQVQGTTYLFKDSPEETQADLRKYERFQAPELKKEKASQDLSNQLAVNNVAYELACPETDLYSLGVILYELFGGRNYTGDIVEARPVLIGQRLIEETVDNILALCDEDSQKRNREILQKLAKLFEEQAGQKYLPRISQNFIWSVGDLQLIKASDRHETRMSVSYRMEEATPGKRSVIVKFLKTSSEEDAKAEQADIQTLLEKIEPRYTAAWIKGGSIAVAEDGKFSKTNDPNKTGLRYYQIFEYIEGTRLDKVILMGEFSEPIMALRLGLQLLRTVQAVHDVGWVHYDIKPDNFILLPNWKKLLNDPAQPQAIKLIDFGSSHRVGLDAPRKSLSPGFKSSDAYEVSGDAKYQIDLNSAVLVIAAMLCGLNPAPNYSPNLDIDLLKQKVGERVFGLLVNMTLPKLLEWKYKTASQFASELEKVLQNQQIMADDKVIVTGSNQQLDIQQEYESIKKHLTELHDDVMNPILGRVEKGGFGILDPESRYFNDKAKDACAHAATQIESLHQLEERATGNAIDLGLVYRELKQEWELVDLKRRLAWAIDKLGEMDLTSALDEARTHGAEKNQYADNLIMKLFDQANRRREKLKEEENTVGSTGQKTQHLKDLSSQLSGSDIPVDDVRKLQSIFKNILESTEKFESLGVEYIYDETTDQKYIKLPSSLQQRNDIRESALYAIDEFEIKARAYVVSSPKTAQRWFEVVSLLRGFLDEKMDAGTLGKLDELNYEVKGNCVQWEQAQKFLDEAEQYLKNPVNGNEEESYWDACQSVGKAFNAYPQHTGIGNTVAACVEKITRQIRLYMAGVKKSKEQEFPKLEAGLIAKDWEKNRLVNFDLPRWLVEAQKQIQQDVLKANGLEERYSKEFDLPRWLIKAQEQIPQDAHKTNNLGEQQYEKKLEEVYRGAIEIIQDETQKIVKESLEIESWIDAQVNKRREIRTVIRKLQSYIDKVQVKDAQSVYDDFCDQYPNWARDFELKEVEVLIAGHLDIPELINRARLSFAREDWESCINYCQKVKNVVERVKLSENLNDDYRSQYLGKSSVEMPEDGYAQFIPVMKQLAMVYQAGQKLENFWSLQDYVEGGKWLDQMEMYGEGFSPLVTAEKQRIAYDDKKSEYIEREKYGDEHFALQSTLTALAEGYRSEFERQCSAQTATNVWIEKSRDLIISLLEFDPGSQTLWVGKRKLWLAELSSRFLAQLTLWIGNLQSRQSSNENDLELAISCLKTTRRIGRILNLDSQQRRWVVLSYYTMRAGQVVEDHQKIVGVWREAVSELSDDAVIKDNFKEAQWKCWLSLLDVALDELAQGEEVNAHLQELFRQDESSAPYLFAPVITAEKSVIPFPLDGFHKEISVRRQSGEKIVKADEILLKNASSLSMVIRDLNNDAGKLGRLELRIKAESLASRFVDSKIQDGDSYKIRGKITNAAIAYIQAFELAPKSQQCIDLVQDNAQAIRQYWQVLKKNIDDLDIRDGLIQSQLKLAMELNLSLEGAEKVRQYARLSSKEVGEARKELNGKMLTLTVGLNLLDHFSPLSDTWQKAVRPSGNEKINISAWQQLKNYSSRLAGDFGKEHAQVNSINLDPVMKGGLIQFKSNVNALYGNYNILQDRLLESGYLALDERIKNCREVNDLARNLRVLESKYHDLWIIWEGKENEPHPYKIYYESEYAAYKTWKFRVQDQPQEYPYWQDSERFNSWLGWIAEFVQVDKTNYEFSQDKWSSFWESQTEVEPCLHSDHAAGLLFLGSFLMLALKVSDSWRREREIAEQKKIHYETLYDNLKEQNKTWLTMEHMRTVDDTRRTAENKTYLQKWIADLSNLLKTPLYLINQSKDDIRLLEGILRELEKLSKKYQEKIEEMETYGKDREAKFNDLFNYANPPSMLISEMQRSVLTQLRDFTSQERFSPEVYEEHMKALYIPFEKFNELYYVKDVYERYCEEIRKNNIFYTYAESLIGRQQ